MSKTALDDLEPRIRLMVALILKNRSALCEPRRGTLALRFHGRHVNATLTTEKGIALDDDDHRPSTSGEEQSPCRS